MRTPQRGITRRSLHHTTDACPLWEGDPRGWMDRLTSTEASCLDQMRRDYLGAYYQLTFSLLFTRAGAFGVRHGCSDLEYLGAYPQRTFSLLFTRAGADQVGAAWVACALGVSRPACHAAERT